MKPIATNSNAGLTFEQTQTGLTIKVTSMKEFLDTFDFSKKYETINGKRKLVYTNNRYTDIFDFLEMCGLLGNDWHDLTDKIALFSGEAIGVNANYSKCDEDTDTSVQYEFVYAYLNHAVYDYLNVLANDKEVFFVLVEQETETDTPDETNIIIMESANEIVILPYHENMEYHKCSTTQELIEKLTGNERLSKYKFYLSTLTETKTVLTSDETVITDYFDLAAYTELCLTTHIHTNPASENTYIAYAVNESEREYNEESDVFYCNTCNRYIVNSDNDTIFEKVDFTEMECICTHCLEQKLLSEGININELEKRSIQDRSNLNDLIAHTVLYFQSDVTKSGWTLHKKYSTPNDTKEDSIKDMIQLYNSGNLVLLDIEYQNWGDAEWSVYTKPKA